MAEPSTRLFRLNRPYAVILIGMAVAAILGAVVFGLRSTAGSVAKFAGIAPIIPPPATPLPAAPLPAGIAPSFDVVRVNSLGDTVIAGRAAPGVEVIIRQSGQEIGRTRADGRGDWMFIPDRPLASGARELTLAARLADGPEIAGAGSVLLVVPERIPRSVAAGGAVGARQPQTPLAVLSGPEAAPRVLQGTGIGNTAGKPAGRLALGAVEYDDKGELRLSGTGRPGARVRAKIDNHDAGETVIDANGNWSMIPGNAVPPGRHQLRLVRPGPDGRVAEQMDYPFQRETVAAGELADGKLVVRPGNSLWLLARALYGQGTRYTVIYDANRAQLRDPAKIYPGQILALPPQRADPDATASGSVAATKP